jgi:hypothetical protein
MVGRYELEIIVQNIHQTAWYLKYVTWQENKYFVIYVFCAVDI